MIPEVSLVIPIHNEASRIWSNTIKLRETIKNFTNNYEIILVENGSTDDTLPIAESLRMNFKEIRLFELNEASLGDAIKIGIKNSYSEKIVYYPIDLSVDLKFISESLNLLSNYDIIIATKRKKGFDKRPLQRIILSKLYHNLVKILYNTSLSDTTCAKAYRKKRITEILNKIPGNSKIFETEVLIEAEKLGRKIIELPVEVRENRPSREKLTLKIFNKLKDLLSSQLNHLAILFGLTIISIGLIIPVFIINNQQNVFYFEHLITLILFLSGCQIIMIGLLTNIIQQIRKELLNKLID